MRAKCSSDWISPLFPFQNVSARGVLPGVAKWSHFFFSRGGFQLLASSFRQMDVWKVESNPMPEGYHNTTLMGMIASTFFCLSLSLFCRIDKAYGEAGILLSHWRLSVIRVYSRYIHLMYIHVCLQVSITCCERSCV